MPASTGRFGVRVVTGIEADIEWVDIDGDDDGDDDDDPDLGDLGFEVNWQGSIRGRVGYAFDRVLLYGTGGFALADIDTDGSGGDDDGGTEWGWTLGAGVDYAVTQTDLPARRIPLHRSLRFRQR